MPIQTLRLATLSFILAALALAQQPVFSTPPITGFRNPAVEQSLEEKFLAVPSPRLAAEHLRILTSEPHIAGSPEDRKTAEYVAQKFREAGLETRIDVYKVWINLPAEILVEATAPAGLKMRGPAREHVEGDPYQDDPRVVAPFNSGSPSGEVEAEVVYANYARPEDFRTLKQMGIDVRGKILIARYGHNYRGVKAFLAQENGAAALILYSDPFDDGDFRGPTYPAGPFRPSTSVQRGSVNFTFEYPGDPTTPGIASTPALPPQLRIAPQNAASLPKIPVTPLSAAEISPLLEKLAGPQAPRDWQGALPFAYHLGSGPVRVHLKLLQSYSYTAIWNVIGTIPGASNPEQLVIAGNHRDAWVYGASDPGSGTAAMLEAVHGFGELLARGWRPQRTIIFASWDAEEQGLIGSTEYAEQYSQPLQGAVAYFNMDVGVAGPNFSAAGVPSLKQFLYDVARRVPSPRGGSVYDAWKARSDLDRRRRRQPAVSSSAADSRLAASRSTPFASVVASEEVQVGDLGSGSDFSPFLQHLGVPSTDIGSSGPYGVYHSVFDNYAWYTKFADPTFAYSQQMARFFGLEVLRMAQADDLPFDYEAYGLEVRRNLETAQLRAQARGWKVKPDFSAALGAATRLAVAGRTVRHAAGSTTGAQQARVNLALINAERALLGNGLPHRPWFRHTVFAPGEYTGYAAVVIPGVNEAIDRKDLTAAVQSLAELTAALERATALLGSSL